VATAAEQLAASIGEINRQVSQSAKISDKAVADARRTDKIVRALAEGAQKIGQVVELITTIASQTNLLPFILRISRYFRNLVQRSAFFTHAMPIISLS
jgi:methyl-accepting chemotaxis protein